MPIGFGRIIRDDAGSIIGVELNDDKPDVQVDPEDVDDVDSRIDPDVRRKWVQDFTQCATGIAPQKSSLIKGESHFCCVPCAPPVR
jgi:nucleolar protein 16